MILALKTNKMTSGFRPVYGHGCNTQAEFDSYIKLCASHGVEAKIVEDDFDFGSPCECPSVIVDEAIKLRREAVLEVIAILQQKMTW